MSDLIGRTDKGCLGGITKEFTVWCYSCSDWDQYAEGGGVKRAKANWIHRGWKRINRAWHCKECAEDLEKKHGQ